MNEALKPCPFCGGKATIAKDNHDKVIVFCENCKMYFGIEIEESCELEEGWRATFPSAEDAIAAWNGRANEKHGHWTHDMEGYARCSVCYNHEENGYAIFFGYCPNCGAIMDGGKDNDNT